MFRSYSEKRAHLRLVGQERVLFRLPWVMHMSYFIKAMHTSSIILNTSTAEAACFFWDDRGSQSCQYGQTNCFTCYHEIQITLSFTFTIIFSHRNCVNNNKSLLNMDRDSSLIFYYSIVSTENNCVTTKNEKDLKIKSTSSPFKNPFMLGDYPIQDERLRNFSNLQRGVNEHTTYY